MLGHLLHLRFHFEYWGSHIIFYDRETEYSEAELARCAQATERFREPSDLRMRRER